MHELQKKIDQLPEELKKEVEDFVEFLSSRISTKKSKASLDWIGGLSELKDQYTSVELQHKAKEWRKGYVPS